MDKKVEARRGGRWGIAVAVLLVILGGWAWMRGGSGDGAGGSETADDGSVETDAARRLEVQRATGLLDPASATLGAISGRVTGVEGKPIEGAQVCARGVSDRWTYARLQFPRCDRSDAQGHYEIEGLLAAEYAVGAFAPSFLPSTYEIPNGAGKRADAFTLADGEQRSGVDLTLRPGGKRLAGHVFDVAGGPVEGAWVTTQNGAWTQTDERGAFELWVPAGRALLAAQALGYAPKWVPVFPPTDIAELYLSPASSISGTVVRADTADPVAGVGIYRVGYEGWPAFARTDDEGRFEVGGLEPGRYEFEARADQYFGRTNTDIAVALGEDRTGITIKVSPAMVVEGTVMLEGTDTPCPGGTVGLHGSRGSAPLVDEFTASAAGAFTLSGVVPDTYRVVVECEDHMPLDSYDALRVTDEPPAPLRLDVRPGLRVSGRVISSDGKPVPSSTLNAVARGHAGAPLSEAETDEDGKFSVSGLAAAEYQFMLVESASAPTPSTPVAVDLSDATDHDDVEIIVAAAGALEGTVRDQHGAPVSGARVEPVPVTGTQFQWGWRKQTRTDASGHYLIEGLGAGPHRIEVGRGQSETFRHPGQSKEDPAGQPVDVVVGQTTKFDIVVLATDAKITGTVSSLDGPVPDAFIQYARMSESEASTGQQGRFETRWAQFDAKPVMTDVDGRFHLEGLQEGSYVVLAQRRGGGEAMLEGVRTGSDISLEIEETGSIEGKVVMEGGDLPARMSLTLSDRRAELEFEHATFASTGDFAFERIPGGNYDLLVESDVGTAKVHVDLKDGERAKGVVVTLRPTHEITGRLVDLETKSPLSDLVVYSHQFNDPSIEFEQDPAPSRVSDAQGRFTLSGVPSGKVVFVIIPRTFDGKLPEIGLVSLVRTVPTKPTAVNIGDLALARRRVFGDETPGKLGFKLREYEPTETPESAVLEVATVEPGGPAAKAGLEVGDVITNIDGHDVSGGDPNGMYSVLLPVPPGTLVKLGVARGPVLSMTSVAAQ